MTMVVCNCEHRLHTLENYNADICSVKSSEKWSKDIEKRNENMTVFCEHRLHSGNKNNRQFCSVNSNDKTTIAIERRCLKQLTTAQ